MMEFRGGTYLTQVQASNLNGAINNWINKLQKEVKDIQYLGEKSVIELKEQLTGPNAEEVPTALKGLVNVWNLCFLIKAGFGTVTVIKTTPA